MDHTHYIPVYTHMVRGSQRAVCGAYVGARDHATEPTYPACAAWLLATHADDEDTARALEAEFPEFRGKLVTK